MDGAAAVAALVAVTTAAFSAASCGTGEAVDEPGTGAAADRWVAMGVDVEVNSLSVIKLLTLLMCNVAVNVGAGASLRWMWL